MLDTRKKEEDTSKQGFDPNVVNEERPADSSGKGGYIFLWIISVISVIGLFIFPFVVISKKNWFKTQQEKINEAASGIDVQLKKRRDTLVKLVDATQTSIKFEKSVLTEVTALRNVNKFTANDKANTAKLDHATRSVLATFENYPNLKTTDTIRDLMQSATILEAEIAAARRLYNSLALQFNQTIQVWYDSVIASGMKLHSFALFAASEEDKKDVDFKKLEV